MGGLGRSPRKLLPGPARRTPPTDAFPPWRLQWFWRRSAPSNESGPAWRFLAKHLGLDIRVTDLSPSFVVPVVNEDGQQLEKKPANAEVAPLLPRDFVILAKLSRSVRGVVSFMACCVLIHALGGVRFRHLQRSIETDFDVHKGILFRCAKGKVRSQGAPAKAFHWVIPVSSFFPVSIAQEFLTNIKRFRGSKPFVVPAFAPPGASLGTAVGFLDEPMKCGAYVGMLRTIVLLGGFTDIPRPSRFPSSKSPRRTLPTVAEAGNIPIDERYQLGDWINASMQGKRRRTACSSSMPLVYAATETKIASQLDLKTRLLDAVQAVVDTIPAANLGTALWEGEVVGLLRQRLAKGLTPPSPVNKPLRSRSRTLSSRPSSSSTSVSNSPSESSEEEERGLEALEWVRPSAGGARTHRMHPRATNSAGFPRPKCCDAQGEPDWGVGIAAALRLSPEPRWCMRCCVDIATRDSRGEL